MSKEEQDLFPYLEEIPQLIKDLNESIDYNETRIYRLPKGPLFQNRFAILCNLLIEESKNLKCQIFDFEVNQERPNFNISDFYSEQEPKVFIISNFQKLKNGTDFCEKQCSNLRYIQENRIKTGVKAIIILCDNALSEPLPTNQHGSPFGSVNQRFIKEEFFEEKD